MAKSAERGDRLSFTERLELNNQTSPPLWTSMDRGKMNKIDKGEGGLGRALGWDNITTDRSKIQDCMLIAATGRDIPFIHTQHRINEIVEADVVFNKTAIEWRDKEGNIRKGTIRTFTGGASEPGDQLSPIFNHLRKKEDLLVTIEPSEPIEGEKNPVIDLRQLAQLLKMKEFNRRRLGRWRMDEAELQKKFFLGEELIVTIPKPDGGIAKIDFWKDCPIDKLYVDELRNPARRELDMERYLKVLRENRLGFQSIVERKELATGGWQKHHAQNSGQAIFAEILFERLPANDNAIAQSGTADHVAPPKGLIEKEGLGIPVPESLCIDVGLGDLGKQNKGFNGKTNPQEIGGFNEVTGTTDYITRSLIARHRKSVDEWRSHDQGDRRISAAAICLSKDEKAQVKSELVNFKESTKEGTKMVENDVKREVNVVYIGGKNKDGNIYKGLHSTHDFAMLEGRGFALTDDEASDKLITDIIGPWISGSQPKDWLMCLAGAAGDQLGYTKQNAIAAQGGDWSKSKPPFILMIPCLDINKFEQEKDWEITMQPFASVNQLIDYINRRIRLGHVLGCPKEEPISGFTGLTKEEMQVIEDEPPVSEPPEIETELSRIPVEHINEYASLLTAAFGDLAEQMIEKYLQDGYDTMIDTGPAGFRRMSDYLKEQIGRLDTSFETVLMKLTKQTNRTKAADAILKIFTELSDTGKRELTDKMKASRAAQK